MRKCLDDVPGARHPGRRRQKLHSNIQRRSPSIIYWLSVLRLLRSLSSSSLAGSIINASLLLSELSASLRSSFASTSKPVFLISAFLLSNSRAGSIIRTSLLAVLEVSPASVPSSWSRIYTRLAGFGQPCSASHSAVRLLPLGFRAPLLVISIGKHQ